MKIALKILILLSVCMGMNALAAKKQDSILSFKDWKSIQVVDHKNRVARLKNQILFLKRNPRRDLSTVDQESLYHKKAKLLDRAKNDLQIATELGFQDYLAVYLRSIGQSQSNLKSVAKKLSEEQVVELLRQFQRR